MILASTLASLMPKTLAARMMLAIAATALPPLIVASTLGLMLITLVSGAEVDFDESSIIARQLSDLRLEIEHENTLVGRIPAELDLAVVQRYAGELTTTAGRIEAATALLATNARIVTRDVAMEIGILRQQRGRIVDGIVEAATSFSQTAALELLNGPFEENSATLLLLLNAIGSRVESIVQLARTHLQTSTQMAWQLTPAALLGVVFTIMLAGWLSRRVFVEPILRLREYAQTIGASNILAVRLDQASLERRDEIGALSRAFDTMVCELADARCELIARSEAEVARQAERLQAALTNMTQGLCMLDKEQRLVVCNKRYAEMYALPEELTRPGTDMTRILMHQVAQGFPAQGENAPVTKLDTATAVVELNDGRIIAIARRSMPGGGEVTTHEDVTELRRSEARVAHMAYHDALTGLANRALLRVELNRALVEAQATRKQVAVLCLDLDRFKEVNDSLGHSVGDSLLKTVAKRLCDCIAKGDTVARLGGDEFVVVSASTDGERAAGLATRIIQGLSAPCELDGHKVDISACVGVALFPEDAVDPEQLFRNADLALYDAKATGGLSYKLYSKDMSARAELRRELEHDLRSALLNAELTLEYQPLVSLKDDSICCCEALLRWNHPQRGRISPADFIPIAESTGLIVPIGQWVLREACKQAMRWPVKIGVAVNLSVAQFKSPGLVQSVTWALAHSGLPPERLELEVTESILLDDSDGALRKLRQLRNLGVRIALDDFGTGYSSLAYLQTFSFDKIKIDRCFVSGLSQGKPTSRAIMRAVAELGASLGIATTAEGVETAEQLEIVRVEGCTEVQGYLFSPPKDAEHIARLVASPSPLVEEPRKPSLPAIVTSDQLPIALANQDEERRLQALHSYGVLDTSPEESFDRITRLARLALNAPMAMISLVDRDRQWFKSKEGVEVDETPRSFSFCTHTIRKDTPLIVGDATQDPRFCNSPLVMGSPNVRAYAGVPLRTPEGYNIGALCVNDVRPREITQDQIAVLQDLGRLVIDELELRRLATIDSLTGALTVRAFHARAARAVQNADALSQPLSCVMFDIDHFKSVNDTYGHAAGDKVLSEVARLCAAGIRSSDSLGRLGGEEFAILAPGADGEIATEIAESLRAAIARQHIEHEHHMIQVTASFGVSVLSDGAADAKGLLARADAALYRAKRAGRNRVEWASSHVEVKLEANVA